MNITLFELGVVACVVVMLALTVYASIRWSQAEKIAKEETERAYDAEQRIHKAAKDAAATDRQLRLCEGRCTVLNTNLGHAKRNAEDLEAQLSQAKKNHSDAEGRYAATVQQLDAAGNQLKQLQGDVGHLTSELAGTQEALKEARQELAKLRVPDPIEIVTASGRAYLINKDDRRSLWGKLGKKLDLEIPNKPRKPREKKGQVV